MISMSRIWDFFTLRMDTTGQPGETREAVTQRKVLEHWSRDRVFNPDCESVIFPVCSSQFPLCIYNAYSIHATRRRMVREPGMDESHLHALAVIHLHSRPVVIKGPVYSFLHPCICWSFDSFFFLQFNVCPCLVSVRLLTRTSPYERARREFRTLNRREEWRRTMHV